MKLDVQEVSKNLGVSPSTVVRIAQLFLSNGNVSRGLTQKMPGL